MITLVHIDIQACSSVDTSCRSCILIVSLNREGRGKKSKEKRKRERSTLPKSYERDAQTEWKEEDSFDAGNRLYPLGSPRVMFQNLLSSHLIVSCP